MHADRFGVRRGLGGRVVAEIVWASVSWQWNRGYVYSGSQLLAVQQGGVYFVHEDPVTKSKKVTDMGGNVQSAVELDPYGGEVGSFSSNTAFQPRKFTTYERDANGTDEAMFRRYNRYHSRFDQPDPYNGSYNLLTPQSLNRYSYVSGDPANFIDQTGLLQCFDVYMVTRHIDVNTGKQVGPAQYQYMYSYCLIDGAFKQMFLQPRDRNPLGPRVPAQRPLGAQDLKSLFDKEYNKCLEDRKHERDIMYQNMMSESVMSSHKAGLWGGAGGAVFGGGITWESGPLGTFVGSVSGGHIGYMGTFTTALGENLIQGAIELPDRIAKHKAQDKTKCEEQAFAAVGRAQMVGSN